MRFILIGISCFYLAACTGADWPRLADPLPVIAEQQGEAGQLAVAVPDFASQTNSNTDPNTLFTQAKADRQAYDGISSDDRLGAQLALTRLSHSARELSDSAYAKGAAALRMEAEKFLAFVAKERARLAKQP